MSPEYDVEEFKKRYPHLASEVLSGKGKNIKLHIQLIDPWRGYVPTVEDYIRRCNTVEEALEVIDYLVKRNELSPEKAEEYKEKLRREGLGVFGGKKEDDYYYKEAMRRLMRTRSETREENIEEEEPS